MPKKKNKIKKTDVLLGEGKFMRLWNRKTWEFVERKGSTGVVIIAAMTKDKKVILVEQFRVPIGKAVIELPAGLVGDINARESFETAAQRELFEETGYWARKIKVVIQGPASSGLSCEELTFCLAEDLVKKGDGGGDHTEDIIPHAVPLDKLESWLKRKEKQGCRIDPKIFAGIYFLNQSQRRGQTR